MAITVRELVTFWGFDINDTPLKRMNKSIERSKAVILAVGAVAVGAAGALFGLTKVVANVGDEAAKTARALGVNVETLQGLQFAASIGGVEVAQFNTGLRTLVKNSAEAADGIATYKDEFDKLNISVTDGNGKLKSSEELLFEMADAFSKMEDGAEKTAIASNLMGRAGSRMINVLNGGREGMQALIKEANDLGFVMSEEATLAAEEFNDEFNRTTSTLKGLRNIIGVGLMPEIQRVVKNFRLWVLENRKLIRTRIERFMKNMITFLREFVRISSLIIKIVNDMVQAFGGWEKVLKSVAIILGALVLMNFATTIGTMVLALKSAITAWRALSFAALSADIAMAALPVIIGLIVIALGLVAQDIASFFQGKDSVFGKLVSGFEEFGTVARRVITGLLTPLRLMLTPLQLILSIIRLIKGDIGFLDFAKQQGQRALGIATLGQMGGASDNLFNALGFQGVTGPGQAPASTPGGGSQQTNVIQADITNNIPTTATNPQEIAQAAADGTTKGIQSILKDAGRDLAPAIQR